MHSMNTLFRCLSLATVLFAAATAAPSDHVTVPTLGGMPAIPLITDIQATNNKVNLTWQSACGPYRVWIKNELTDATWVSVTPIQFSNTATLTLTNQQAFFRISGPSPIYAGSQACMECHEDVHMAGLGTAHNAAFVTLKNIGQQNNPSCLPCHTVGYNLPTGFVSESKTPWLAGVQCESCHGPAGRHAANDNDPTLRPPKDIAGQLCGGCHTGSHQPTYDEWVTTGHANVVEDMNPAGRINGCGRCHSGSSRLALLKGEDPVVTVTGDANMGITCVVCHNPHATTANPHQLLNPTRSTNDYFLSTSDVFTNKYNADINLCAQCHNHRGAAWTSSSRPPHHSPQYNMMLGTVGETATNFTAVGISTHGRALEKQCVTCHMASEEYVSESQPAVTGHNFKVENFDSCYQCHPFPELLTQFSMGATASRIAQVKSALDLWATTKAPEALRNKYGALAWEYTTPGSLSTGTPGPSSSEQAQIPEAIKKARFNLYIVTYDGSFGVHNPLHTVKLLDSALVLIQQELNK
jgi:nitrate/TMAO reductase-like tetraheme cytochrome c subunit